MAGGTSDHVLAVDQDLPAGDVLESGDQAQQRRLAAAGRPDEDHEGAVLDLQVGILDDVDRSERFPDSLQRDLAHDLWFPLLFDGAEGQSADELPLA